MTDDDQGQPPTDEELIALRTAAGIELAELRTDWEERSSGFDATDAGDIVGPQRSLWQDAMRRFGQNRLAMAGLLLLLLYVVLAIFVPTFSDANTTRVDYSQSNLAPSTEHLLGTDRKGKDMWKKSWEGARISLSIAAGVALVILVIGVVYGAISGYLGGIVDVVMMRLLDALYGLPYLPFAIITVTIISTWFDAKNPSAWERFLQDTFGKNPSPMLYMVPALSITAWFTSARIIRGQMLSLKQNEYVEGARAAGARGVRIVRKHLLPNTFGVLVVAMFLEIPNAILGEAFLSILGLGVDPPRESWGTMAEQGYKAYNVQPWLMWAPAGLIASTVLATIAIADGLRDALDPRGRAN